MIKVTFMEIMEDIPIKNIFEFVIKYQLLVSVISVVRVIRVVYTIYTIDFF